MGFSLEALVAVPCCLSILAYTTGLAGPVASAVKKTGNISAYAATQTSVSNHTCLHHTIGYRGGEIPVVETCPQKIVEALSLAHDMIELFHSAPKGTDPQ